MSGVSFALDTTAAIQLLNAVEPLPSRVAQQQAMALPLAVAAELLMGALNSQRQAYNLQRHQELIDSSVVLNPDLDTALEYARLHAAVRQAGRPIPHNDIWIAATCLQHGLILITADRHFDYCPNLVTEDWSR
jgi:tRNA(fMet)-specific endonuclease VapC